MFPQALFLYPSCFNVLAWLGSRGTRKLACVSTEDQILDLQRDALKRAKCREVCDEQAAGKNTARSQLEACLKSLREGYTLIVCGLDRVGRNLADLVCLVAQLEQRKINFESLTEKIETVSPAGRLVFHVFAALAEFERSFSRLILVATFVSLMPRTSAISG
jgi:DNA invertase Pin-like site-specific DNA recombinase